MKKIAVFLFACGVGMSAYAVTDPECVTTCDQNYDACVAANPGAYACVKIWRQCQFDCDQAG